MEEKANIESDGQLEAGGESIKATGGEPSTEGLFDGMTGQQLHDSYKSLQGELGKRTESNKESESRFERYGGADRLLGLAEELDGNPKFAEWYKEQQQAQVMGDGYADYDDDTKQALELVSKMTQSEIQRAMDEQVGPIREQMLEQQMEANIESLQSDPQYAAFDDLKDEMSKIIAESPKDSVLRGEASIDDIKDLYWKAMRTSGKMDEYAAKQYQAKLEQAKKQSSDAPSQKATPSKIQGNMSMLESARAAGMNV